MHFKRHELLRWTCIGQQAEEKKGQIYHLRIQTSLKSKLKFRGKLSQGCMFGEQLCLHNKNHSLRLVVTVNVGSEIRERGLVMANLQAPNTNVEQWAQVPIKLRVIEEKNPFLVPSSHAAISPFPYLFNSCSNGEVPQEVRSRTQP